MKQKNRKWLVFAVLCLAYMPGSYAQYQLSVYAPELMSTDGLSTSQFAAIFTSPMMIAIFLSFLGGMISDKYGPKKVTAVAFVLTVVGLLGRIFANSYGLLFLCMALTGFSQMFVNTNASKITGSWFEPAKVGLLMGIFSFCGQLPGAFATATTAFLFRSMKEAFVVSAVFGILVFVLWIMFVSDRPESTEAIEQEQQESVPLQEALQVVLKNKGVWMVAICIMMILGTNVTFSTFLPTTLQSMYGLDLTTCGTIASMLTLGNCIGSIAGPLVFAKVKKIRRFIPGTAALSFVLVMLCWRFPNLTALYLLMLLSGISLGAAMPVFFSAPIFLEGIGVRYAGTAAGVIATLQLLGAVLIPTYVLTPIAGDNYGLLFSLASICMVVMFVVSCMIPEFEKEK